jgi:hypothetical protein
MLSGPLCSYAGGRHIFVLLAGRRRQSYRLPALSAASSPKSAECQYYHGNTTGKGEEEHQRYNESLHG